MIGWVLLAINDGLLSGLSELRLNISYWFSNIHKQNFKQSMADVNQMYKKMGIVLNESMLCSEEGSHGGRKVRCSWTNSAVSLFIQNPEILLYLFSLGEKSIPQS